MPGNATDARREQPGTLLEPGRLDVMWRARAAPGWMEMDPDLELYLAAIDWDDRLRQEIPAIDRVIELQRGKGQLCILDVGCGHGIHLHALARMHPCHVFDGIDVDAARAAHARAMARDAGLPVTIVEGDFMERAAFPHAPYDIIYAIGNSIALVWGCGNVDAVIEKVASLLAPGGYFFFQIQNNDHPRTGMTTSRVVTLASGEERFTAKRYEPDHDLHAMRVDFITFTRHPGAPRFDASVTPYSWHLISWNEITRLLKAHEFTRVDAWADYASTPFDPASSTDVITLAKKNLGESMLCDGKGMRLAGRWTRGEP